MLSATLERHSGFVAAQNALCQKLGGGRSTKRTKTEFLQAVHLTQLLELVQVVSAGHLPNPAIGARGWPDFAHAGQNKLGIV